MSNSALLQLFELTNLKSLELFGGGACSIVTSLDLAKHNNLSSAEVSKLANLTLRSYGITEEDMIILFSKLNNLETVDIGSVTFLCLLLPITIQTFAA